MAARITTAAKDNKNFHVTSTTALNANGTTSIYLTEKEGGVDTDNYKLEGKTNADATTGKDGDWTGLVKIGKVDTANMGTALTLQIGDTSDSYNQLKVTVFSTLFVFFAMSSAVMLVRSITFSPPLNLLSLPTEKGWGQGHLHDE